MHPLRGAVMFALVTAILSGMLFVSPANAQVPSCLTGDWRASNIDTVFRDLFASTPEVQVNTISGDILLSIQGDGSFEFRYASFTMGITTSSGPLTSVTDGSMRGRLREVRPGSIVGTMTESALTSTITVAGTTMTNTLPLDGQEEESPVAYDCNRGQVTFTSMSGGADQRFELTFVRR